MLRKTFALVSMGLMGIALGIFLLGAVYYSVSKDLPEIEGSDNFALEVPLRIYTADGLLLGEFGAQRRTPVEYEDIPPQLVHAFMSAEDDRFFEHPGVDYQGLLRAVYVSIKSGSKAQGGSTITMQVARNFFLSSEKSYKRKLTEIFLALKIERHLSKEEILSLYLNKIFMGKRAYGVKAAAEVYYGSPLEELTIAQMAMIAGLPKAPSRYNPLTNPERALLRRNYVLRRMNELGYIDDETFAAAKEESVSASLQKRESDLDAPYVTEMVRDEMVQRYGDAAYSQGFHVYTTVNSGKQASANRSLRKALQAYDRRHGFRGPLNNWLNDEGQLPAAEDLDEMLASVDSVGLLKNAVVTQVGEQVAEAYVGDGLYAPLAWEGIQWARKQISVDARGPEITTAAEVLAVGDVIRIEDVEGAWYLAQEPEPQGAFVSVRAEDGAIMAIGGGYDYQRSKFNRAVQAYRQPGSSLKPFLYSAALDKGYTAATIVNDAPVVFHDDRLETSWRPENYTGKVYGPTRLRKALTYSRNLVSIRVLRNIGIGHTRRHMVKFGLPAEGLPRDLSLSLGSASLTPMQLAEAYAVFANGGFRVSPYVIERIENDAGEVLWQANPKKACDARCRQEVTQQLRLLNEQVATTQQEDASETDQLTVSEDLAAEVEALEGRQYAPQVIDEQNAYIMRSMLQDVVRVGTAVKAKKALQRNDLAGKTGTTNDQKDAWFAGFAGGEAAIAWVGFDKVTPMGRKEAGGTAALPMWIDYMQENLAGLPEAVAVQPAAVTMVRISKTTGLRVPVGAENSMFEVFRTDNVPAYEGAAGSLESGSVDEQAPSDHGMFSQPPTETGDDDYVDDLF